MTRFLYLNLNNQENLDVCHLSCTRRLSELVHLRSFCFKNFSSVASYCNSGTQNMLGPKVRLTLRWTCRKIVSGPASLLPMQENLLCMKTLNRDAAPDNLVDDRVNMCNCIEGEKFT